jgi:predicted ATPase
LRSLDSIVPNTLPTQITSFVGRERELSTVQQLLDTSRLVTLTGVGGAGKSRLSVQAASAVADRYPDGVWFVELAPLAQADLVPQTVATALGIREEASRPIRETLLDTLARKKSLIVLDNCEHLIASCALLTDALIRTCPTLSVLASSREPLQISGETTFRVPPLAFADPDRLPPLERLANEYEAIRLFCERAAAAKPAFTLDAANARAIARICSQLDGIPLAIELAAARVNVLTPNQIAERLQDRFKLLTGGSRTALPRQQTLRALIDWSYDLLTEPEKTLLCRLSVFAGGCTLEAAEAVCADNVLNRDEIFDVLCSLVEKSLVVADDKGRHARYRLLETLRQYGREKLSLDEAAATELRHVQHFLNVLGECDAAGYYSSRIDDLDLLTSEYDNFRAAMAWAAAQTSPAERSLGACIAVHLHDLWFVRGECDEGLGWLAAARANDVTDVPGHSITWMGVRVPATGACIRSLALTRSAQIAWVHTDYQKAKAFLAEARQVPDSVEYPAIWS